MTEPFDQVKQQILANLAQGLDFSPKGSIDIPVRDLVSLLNALPDYVTTSSCSGRVSVSFPLHENKGVRWTFVKHGFVTREEIERAIVSHTETDTHTDTHAHTQAKDALYTLKCEPLILHLCCRDVEAARAMHQLAAECGYRESGVTLGQRRAMLAIRTTAFHLELPLARNGAFLFARESETNGESGKDFLQVLVDEANDRLRQNFARADRLLSAIKQRFAFPYFSLCALSESFPSLSTGQENDAYAQPTQRNALFRQEPHLWLRAGHTTFSHNAEGTDMVVLGGQGVESPLSSPAHNTQRCGRNVTHFSLSEYCAAHKGLSSSSRNSLTENRARSLYNDLPQCVHARVIPLTVRTQHGDQPRHVLVVSGGRASPAAPPLPCASVYVLCEREGEKKYVLIAPERVRCEGGICPSARWAHTAERLAENSFFLCGGRDSERVYEDAFIATLHWQRETEAVPEEELQLVVRWEQPEWHCVTSSQPSHSTTFSSRDVFARYAHACVSLWAAEESAYSSESGGRQLLIHRD